LIGETWTHEVDLEEGRKNEDKRKSEGVRTCISDQLEPDTLYIGNIGLTSEHSLGTDLESDACDFCSESTETLQAGGRPCRWWCFWDREFCHGQRPGPGQTLSPAHRRTAGGLNAAQVVCSYQKFHQFSSLRVKVIIKSHVVCRSHFRTQVAVAR